MKILVRNSVIFRRERFSAGQIAMAYPIHEKSLLLTASRGTRSNNNSTSVFQLRPTLRLDPELKHTLEVRSASITNVNPNISAALGNNTWTFNLGGLHTYVIPDGLYGLAELASYIRDQVVNDEVFGPLPSNLFIFEGDGATQKVSLGINAVGVSIDWATNTIGSILGFVAPADNIGPTITAETYFDGSQPASFNSTTAYLIRIDAITGTYDSGQGNSDVACAVVINSRPGSLQGYEPYHPLRSEVLGTHIDQLTVRITDQAGKLVDMRNEDFTVGIVISSWPKYRPTTYSA